MYISRFRIRNYKSFREPGAIELRPGFNIVTGQNSSGKTALLEALSLNFGANPHRSLATAPSADISPEPTSRADFTFNVGRSELFELLLARPQNYLLPFPAASCALTPGFALQQGQDHDIVRFLEVLFSRDEFSFSLRRTIQAQGPTVYGCDSFPTLGLYPAITAPQSSSRPSFGFRLRPDRTFEIIGRPRVGEEDMGTQLAPLFERHVYRFDPQRFNVGTCQFGDNPVLSPQATNLPEVLNCLQPNPDAFSHFNTLVNQILPHVRSVSVRPRGQMLEIIVWNIDPSTRRADLARPLSESGTGIGQVLAILYVALTTTRPQILLIDEPQSFLHPGAVRKLMEILRDHSQHQYVISTHSPAVISGCEPATVTLLRFASEESSLEQVDPSTTRSLQTCLSEVGARLADVFGADNILWVEGPTEEACFPKILRRVARRQLMGTAVLGVRQVGDLEGRDAERVFEMLERLSQGPSLLPPTIGVALDSECRAPADKEGFSRRRGRPVHFLPRRMYENYLLDPDAVAEVLNQLDGMRQAPLDPADVAARIGSLRRNRMYFCPRADAHDGEDWIVHVDGANLLRDLFGGLSEARVSYDKVRDSTALTEWLIENRPDSLRELADFLVAALDARRP